MDKYPNANHVVVYYDDYCNHVDGNGWCVETSDSPSITDRFPLLRDALYFVAKQEEWMQEDMVKAHRR